ncbi:MAG: thiosulfate oxidation carrier protein SoxY [Gemmatimonadota bacterium]
MNQSTNRRAFLQSCGLVLAAVAGEGVLGRRDRLSAAVRPWSGSDPDEPEAPNEIVQKILTDRFGDRKIVRGHVTLEMPAVAEDGRVVPVSIDTDLPMTTEKFVKAIYLIVDHNPDPLVSVFHLTPSIGAASINTRIKMKRTCWIRAIAETNTGELWAGYTKVETTLNGCG